MTVSRELDLEFTAGLPHFGRSLGFRERADGFSVLRRRESWPHPRGRYLPLIRLLLKLEIGQSIIAPISRANEKYAIASMLRVHRLLHWSIWSVIQTPGRLEVTIIHRAAYPRPGAGGDN